MLWCRINPFLKFIEIEGSDVKFIQADDPTLDQADKLTRCIGTVHDISSHGEILEHHLGIINGEICAYAAVEDRRTAAFQR